MPNYTKIWENTRTYKLPTNWDEIADEWEWVEPHVVCEGGTYPSEDDAFFNESAGAD